MPRTSTRKRRPRCSTLVSPGERGRRIITEIFMSTAKNRKCRWLILVLTAAALLGVLPRWASSTEREVEPNNACEEAQDLGSVQVPFMLQGSVDTPPIIP